MERKKTMGVMTDAMKRLRGEVDALRDARGVLVQDLAIGTRQRRDVVATMQAGFRKTHEAMAGKMKKARVAFVTDLAADAMKMIEGFHKARSAMAKRARAERLTFVLGQKRTVASLRHAVAADLAGAHRFWHGPFAVEMSVPGLSVGAGRPSAHAGNKAGGEESTETKRHPIQAEHKAVENAHVHRHPASEAREPAKEEHMKHHGGHLKMKGGGAKGKKKH
jgi:hypothetical protein